MAVLITFGLLTLSRMLKRNENSDKYKIAMDNIRKTVSNELDTVFSGSTDYIEAYVYDENQNQI